MNFENTKEKRSYGLVVGRGVADAGGETASDVVIDVGFELHDGYVGRILGVGTRVRVQVGPALQRVVLRQHLKAFHLPHVKSNQSKSKTIENRSKY